MTYIIKTKDNQYVSGITEQDNFPVGSLQKAIGFRTKREAKVIFNNSLCKEMGYTVCKYGKEFAECQYSIFPYKEEGVIYDK